MIRHRARRSAFTLVETVTAMTVLAVLSSVSATLVWSALSSLTDGAERSRLHADLSVAMERIVRELRAIPLDTSNAPDITRVATDAISWADGTLAISVSEAGLVYAADGTDYVLAPEVRTLTIEPFDSANGALATPLLGAACEPVRRIAITIGGDRAGVSCTVRTKLFLRCKAMEFMQ